MTAKTDDRIAEDAARWYLRTSSPDDPGDAQGFELWLAESEAHRAAYQRTLETLADVDLAAGAPSLALMAQEARERAGRRRPPHRAIFALAASVILCLTGAIMLLVQSSDGSDVQFESPLGRRSQVTMRDGSRLWLDSNTRIKATFTGAARTVRLEEGQARFRVAHDSERPFSVIVAGQAVVATGTDFNVERLKGQSVVTLLQGSVYIQPDVKEGIFQRIWPGRSPSPHAVRLRPGDRLSISDDGIARLQKVDPQDAVLWEDGTLILDDEPLEVAVERLNRFNSEKLVLDDPAIRHIKISGLFSVADPEAFATAVTQHLQLEKSRKSDGFTHLTISRSSK